MKNHKTILPDRVYEQALSEGLIDDVFFTSYGIEKSKREKTALLRKLNENFRSGKWQLENP